MKKLLGFLGASLLGVMIILTQIGCPAKSTTSPAKATPTPTQHVAGAATATPTATLITCSTGCTIVYDNGTVNGQTYGCSFCTWSGGGDAPPALNTTDTTLVIYPNGETQSMSYAFGTLVAGGWSGDTWVAGAAATGPFPNFEAYTQCIWYACASEAGTAGFETILPSGTSSTPATIVNVPLTTSWQAVTFSIADGSRTDGEVNNNPPTTSIASVGTWLVIDVPGNPPDLTSPATVYMDMMRCQ